MRVTVEYNHYLLRELIGSAAEPLELDQGSSLEDLLAALQAKYGKPFKRLITRGDRPAVTVLINGVLARKMDTRLPQGARVNILVRTTGG